MIDPTNKVLVEQHVFQQNIYSNIHIISSIVGKS